MGDGPVMIKVEGNLVELKAGPPPMRFALGTGDLVLAQGDVPVATLERSTSSVATWLAADFARGDSGFKHAGLRGSFAATFTPNTPPGTFVRGLPFNAFAAMAKVGFYAVRGTLTEATTYDGDSIDGAGIVEFELFLDGCGEGNLMSAFEEEQFRFSELLIGTTRLEPRLCERVVASYRRDPNGISRSPAFLFALPCRAERGPSSRTLRGLEFLRQNGFPIMYEVARRCNWYCVRYELVAYRELVPVRLRLHVDSMAELSI